MSTRNRSGKRSLIYLKQKLSNPLHENSCSSTGLRIAQPGEAVYNLETIDMLGYTEMLKELSSQSARNAHQNSNHDDLISRPMDEPVVFVKKPSVTHLSSKAMVEEKSTIISLSANLPSKKQRAATANT